MLSRSSTRRMVHISVKAAALVLSVWTLQASDLLVRAVASVVVEAVAEAVAVVAVVVALVAGVVAVAAAAALEVVAAAVVGVVAEDLVVVAGAVNLSRARRSPFKVVQPHMIGSEGSLNTPVGFVGYRLCKNY
ncbi:hypothetical protein F5Y07DRAFT_49122 [Xylaria sp. FL0933]|nr:hypothetical protein F5Y07DRAFT_49122 [Xylaria sp. FL0933]